MERVKWTVLLAIWVLWAVIIGVRSSTYQVSGRVPLTFVSGQRLSRGHLSAESAGPRLATWHLIRRAKLSPPAPKNIFAPLTGRPSPSHKRTSQTKPRSTRVPLRTPSPPASPTVYVPPPPPPPPSPEEIAVQQARMQRELAVQQARQLMGQYRYLGYLLRDGERSGFLSKGQELYIVRVGEMVEGHIHAATIDGTVLTLRDSTHAVERSISLTSSSE